VSQPVTRLLALVALGVAAVTAGLIATGRTPSLSRSGGSSNTAALDRAFSSSEAKSGKVAIDARITAEGAVAARLGGAITMRMTGAFDARRPARPAAAVDGVFEVASQRFGFGVTLVNRRFFIGFNGANYEVPRAQAEQVFQASAQRVDDAGVQLLGIDPKQWFKDVSDEGTATVDGVVTRRVTASVDTGKMIEDLFTLASRAPGAAASAMSPEEREEIKDALKDLHADVYTGQADGVMRRMVLSGEVEDDEGRGRFDFDMHVTDVNKPQRIVAPVNVKPFTQLQNDLDSGLLSGLAGGATRPTTPPASAPSAPPVSSAGSAAVPGEVQPYLACVRRAGSPAELQGCASLLR
jgi:hypothetical protein